MLFMFKIFLCASFFGGLNCHNPVSDYVFKSKEKCVDAITILTITTVLNTNMWECKKDELS